jgi:hypothetical protein
VWNTAFVKLLGWSPVSAAQYVKRELSEDSAAGTLVYHWDPEHYVAWEVVHHFEAQGVRVDDPVWTVGLIQVRLQKIDLMAQRGAAEWELLLADLRLLVNEQRPAR